MLPICQEQPRQSRCDPSGCSVSHAHVSEAVHERLEPPMFEMRSVSQAVADSGRANSNETGETAISGGESTVSDTGIGLPSDESANIFDAFVTKKQDGMGLGLSISRTIIEAHGGRIWTTANLPRGATFHVALPGEEHSADCA